MDPIEGIRVEDASAIREASSRIADYGCDITSSELMHIVLASVENDVQRVDDTTIVIRVGSQNGSILGQQLYQIGVTATFVIGPNGDFVLRDIGVPRLHDEQTATDPKPPAAPQRGQEPKAQGQHLLVYVPAGATEKVMEEVVLTDVSHRVLALVVSGVDAASIQVWSSVRTPRLQVTL